ncbi:uncharacterized protein LOC8284215 [Ricinus communis]|uniref:AT hook motif-containing protein n=1 Tax=Ricinus communis TaxID=3988 RepID=B9RXM9_RICCO|nr:uncharacterized protein LOC8284215 [Ricinus communis]XP_015574321.1 uncharacterized protein LOC8284215 [Ricinus communis]XP_015574322.1 uncharacterized protein LOC8284215 [Ricinus communis]EEF43885.1 hypothetical protein RCOM_0905070 [Ricinus communis]|eukprot:XP_002518498.1 uncharacterized protein LOC8284215 [Ricinus communis]
MNPQSQGTSSSSPADPPLKRKRGRPRKDESMVQGENMPATATPSADSLKKNKQSVGTAGAVSDEMVGKVVSGVIEGSFDAGYLLKVKVGDTETHLRGVVFLPGRFTPITASNDVAPEAKMYRRTEMPIPVPTRPSQVPGPVPSSEERDKQPVELQHLAPINQVKSLSSELQSSVPLAQENQPSSNMLPLIDNLPPMSTTKSSLGGGVASQQILESVTGSQSASVMANMGHEKVTGRNDMLKEFEASLTELPNVNVEATEQSKAMPHSAPPIHSFPGSGTINPEQEIQPQIVSNNFKPSQVCDGVKIPNLEHNHVPVITEPGIMSTEPFGTKVWAEKQASPKKVEPPELPVKIFSGTDATQLNGRPISHAPKITNAETDSAPSTGLPAILFEREAIPSEPKLTSEGSSLQRMIEPQLCNSGGPNITKEDSDSAPVTGLPVMLFEREAIPSECKLGIDGPVLPRMTEPQLCISPGVSNSMDCNLKDAIPPTES